MSTARKQAVISCTLWLVISAFLVTILFSSGIESFADPDKSWLRVLIAAVILPGYIYNVIVMIKARRARENGEMDERDEAIASKASEVTLVVLAMLVYVFGIGLFEAYRGVGAVPAGWLYFMAYGCMALVWLVHPAVTLVLDYGGKVDG